MTAQAVAGRPWWRPLLAALGLACWAGAASAQAATEAEADAEMLRGWLAAIEPRLLPPPPGVLDAELQRAAVELAALARQRIAAQAPLWVAEMRGRLKPARKTSELYPLLHQRLQHEEALWKLQPLTPELTEAWITAAIQPGFCTLDDGPSWYSRQVARWALVPVGARAALLASERAAIARIGEAPLPPARPAQGALDAGAEALERVRQQGPRPRVPMPPVLAYRVLAPALPLERLQPVQRCALNQWWLREQLAQAAPADAAARAAAWQAFRFDWIPNLDDYFGGRAAQRDTADTPAAAEAAGAYPRLPRQQELTGTVTVRVTLDERGRVRQAQVAERQPQVPGVPGRPVAYETALDSAALAQARDPARVTYGPGKPVRLLDFVFKLD